MARRDSYERKVSAEEAREGYVMVLKGQLGFFPPVGEPFGLNDGGVVQQARLEAEPCTCRGPEKPHEHYFIRRPGLVKGQRVIFRRADRGGLVLTV